MTRSTAPYEIANDTPEGAPMGKSRSQHTVTRSRRIGDWKRDFDDAYDDLGELVAEWRAGGGRGSPVACRVDCNDMTGPSPFRFRAVLEVEW